MFQTTDVEQRTVSAVLSIRDRLVHVVIERGARIEQVDHFKVFDPAVLDELHQIGDSKFVRDYQIGVYRATRRVPAPPKRPVSLANPITQSEVPIRLVDEAVERDLLEPEHEHRLTEKIRDREQFLVERDMSLYYCHLAAPGQRVHHSEYSPAPVSAEGPPRTAVSPPPWLGLTSLEALSKLGEALTDFSRCPSSKFIVARQ